MPVTYYTEAEYKELEGDIAGLRAVAQELESLRPQWAMGYTSDSQAAQSASNAMWQMWEALGVTNQTHAMQRLNQLLNPGE